MPIWGGYLGLVVTGVLLEPDPSSRRTAVKLALALLIGLDGLVATALHRFLAAGPSRGTLVAGGVCAAVSQVGWWGSSLIGCLNAH